MHDLTRCVHHPAVPQDGFSSLAVPTYRASTIVYPDIDPDVRLHARSLWLPSGRAAQVRGPG